MFSEKPDTASAEADGPEVLPKLGLFDELWLSKLLAADLFPLLLSPGVLEPASLASLSFFFSWRCLIKIFVVSVFITCPSGGSVSCSQT